MAKKTIDENLYAQLVAKGHGKAESYRLAGYKPQGKVDNAKNLANQLEKRADVQKLLADYRERQYGDLKDVTKARLEQLLTEDWKQMDTDQRIKFLGQACKITGVEAPKNININQNTKITQEVSVDQAIAGIMDDDRFRHLFAREIESVNIKGPEEESNGVSSIRSDEDK